MNEHEEHLDPRLTEALGPVEPDPALAQRILALTDARLTEALDRALGPHSVACDRDELVHRILAATSERPAVVGRIGFAWGRAAWRVAAAVAVCAGAYLLVTSLTEPSTELAQPVQIAENTGETPVSELDEMEREITLFADADTPAFEQRIALVSAGVEQMRSDTMWAESPDALVDRAADPADWYPSDDAAATPEWF